MSYDIEIDLIIADEQVSVCVDYTVTYWGSPGVSASLSYPGDPPEAPEFEINSITFEKDGVTCELEWDKLSQRNQELIDECIYEQLAEGPYDPDYE